MLRPRPDRTTAVPPGAEESRLTDASDSALCPEPQQAIVCCFCKGYVTAREAVLYAGGIGTLTLKESGATHEIVFFRAAQVRLDKQSAFAVMSKDLDAAHCRFCDTELGLRITKPDEQLYALLLDRICGA